MAYGMVNVPGISSSGSTTTEMHRVTFRGKNLGDTYTREQMAQVYNGTFDDLYLGDYWLKDDVKWRIVDINYWYSNYGVSSFQEGIVDKPHLVIMPDSSLYEDAMGGPEGYDPINGYYNSYMYKTGLDNAKNMAKELFSLYADAPLILYRKEVLINNITDNAVSGVITAEASFVLPSELMIFGNELGLAPGKEPDRSAYSRRQLALFAVAPQFIGGAPDGRTTFYWLRDSASTDYFLTVTTWGSLSQNECMYPNPGGVRPVFGVLGYD